MTVEELTNRLYRLYRLREERGNGYLDWQIAKTEAELLLAIEDKLSKACLPAAKACLPTAKEER